MDTLTLAGEVLALDWNTGLLQIVGGAMKFAAVFVVIGAFFKGVKDVTSGKVGNAVKIAIGAAILVTFLWDPSLIEKIIDAFTGLTSSGIDQIDSIVTNPGGGTVGGGGAK